MLKIYNDPNSKTNLMAHTRLDSNQIVSTPFCNCRYNIATPPYGLPPTITNSFIPHKGVFKGGFKPPPPKKKKISDFFLKSEGKEIERKRKKEMLVEGLPLNIFLGLIFFRVGFRYFQGVLRNFQEGLRNFRGGVEKFSGGGVEKFLGGG